MTWVSNYPCLNPIHKTTTLRGSIEETPIFNRCIGLFFILFINNNLRKLKVELDHLNIWPSYLCQWPFFFI
jgi:hypothetical protein